MVIAILKDDEGRAAGLLCLCTDHGGYEILLAGSIIYATGGPAGIYMDSCYPTLQHGMSGAAYEAGALGKNLTEWQYGLASIAPRWNVSGTYMQVLPRFISTDRQGGDAREFLPDYIQDPAAILDRVFLKGYQWPFDVRKVDGGSSVIDILVYMELCKNRRVYLDFRSDPAGGQFDFEKLSQEAYEYLRRANALVPGPLERLKIMNQPAIDFYMENGVDLSKEMLEISLCAQHNNGGIDIDLHWQSGVEGFFVVGEAAGSHGLHPRGPLRGKAPGGDRG